MSDLIPSLPVLAVDMAIKASILLVLAWAFHFMAGQSRARLRSALWNACQIGLLLLPVASLALPRLCLPVLPEPDDVAAGPATPIQATAMPVAAAFENRGEAWPVHRPMIEPQALMPFPEFETEKSQGNGNATHTAFESQFRWRPHGVPVALALYLAVVSVLSMRLVMTFRSVGRLVRSSVPVDEPAWVEGLARARCRVGIARSVSIVRSDRISVPMVAGCLRPAVILPDPLAGAADSGLIDAVLLHELAHIRRGDYLWNVIRRLVQALYWPHPLVWPLGRVVSAVREQACDDLCVHILGGPDGYHDSLVEVAAGLVRGAGPALGMAMARSTTLARRIDWIHRTRGATDCIMPRPARLAMAVSMLSLAGLIGSIELARVSANSAEPAQESKSDKPASKEKTRPGSKPDSKANPQPQPKPVVPDSIEITVLAKDTGKPLANASISAYVDRKMEFLKTDKAGKARIDLAGRTFLDTMSIDAWAEGYVQQRHAFSNAGDRAGAIPGDLNVELWPGEETLGGKVVDEHGQPVAGAKVEIWGYLGTKEDPHELAYMVDAMTDARGLWRCRSFRKMTWAYLYLSHPEFLADTDRNPRVHGRIDANGEPTPNEQPFQGLRDFTDVEVLKKGIRITGRVVDEAGKPVAGAEIGWIRLEAHRSLQLDVQKAVADADGHFELPQTRPGQVVLQFQAPGHATDLKVVTAKESMNPLTITLGRAYSMRGRVVDTNGNPIAACEVLVDAWGGYGGYGFFLKTDAEGRFRWDDAPAEGVLLKLAREGFESIDRFRVDPAGGEAIVTLKRALQITGSILDAESGEKIKGHAEVEVGKRNRMTGQFDWTPASKFRSEGGGIRVTAVDGQLRASLVADAVSEYRLRVRANGYAPFESRDFGGEEDKVQFDIRLTKAEEPKTVTVKGVVRRPDGKPLEGAEVALAVFAANGPVTGGNLQHVQVRDGKIERIRNQNVVKTDAEGRFALNHVVDSDSKPSLLVIVHPEYYAEVPQADYQTDLVIVARPWGRIEGVARLGNRLAGDAKIRYHSNRFTNAGEPYVTFSGEMQTDAEGKFVIERVVPGELQVIRVRPDPATRNLWYASTLVKVKSGETARVELGGKGRPVIARIERPAGFDPDLDYAANSECHITSDRPRIPYPKDVLARRDGSMSDWYDRWWNSPEGFEYRKNWREFGVEAVKSDDTIRVEEVPPGDYELRLTYSGEPVFGGGFRPANIGYAKLKFTVPEIPGGYTDEPLDLGTLKPLPKPELKTGEAVPDFDAETLDGKRLKLADLRGKFVLLDFWATWCGPCVDEIPEMKAVFERYGKGDRFAMVSLSLDADKEAPRKFVAEQGLGWHQGWLGDWAEGGVQDAYHVEAIPATFLIGPDGKLVARGLRGSGLSAAVARAMGGR